MKKREWGIRASCAARAAWGAFLLDAPSMVLQAVGHHAGRRAVLVVRVLGVRHIAQSALTAVVPNPAVVRAGAVADSLHAVSAVAVALVSENWRRTALADAAVAIAFTALGRHLLLEARPHPPLGRSRSPT
ncbi:hypothetical protein KRM28CT15_47120 [Krasilnikovia sp. M28-CT-15]